MQLLQNITIRSLRLIGHYMGLFWTKIILGVFYFTIFLLAALLVKIFKKDLLNTKKRKISTWQNWETVVRLEDLYRPF